MKKYFLFMLWAVPLNLLAQEPQWELFFPDLTGPIAVDPTDSDIIYIAPAISANNGMWKTRDGGQSWDFYDEGWGMGTPRDILIDPENPNIVLVSGGPFVGVQKSEDGGQTWIRADYGFTVDHHGFEIRDLALDRQRSVFYAADDGTFCGVFQSTDGVSWQKTTTGFSPFCPQNFVIDEENGVIYAGSGNGVWKSADAGSTWAKVSNGIPFQSPTPPVTYPVIWDLAQINHSQTLYCVVSNRGIYKSYDGGENWFSVNDSLTNKLSFRGGLVVAEADTNTIFAGAGAKSDPTEFGGLYVSRNGGGSWELLKYGLSDSAIDMSAFQLFLDKRNNTLYTSITLLFSTSQEENVYRMSNAIITKVEEIPHTGSEFQLTLRNYPNPFNGETLLLYSIPKTGRVTLKIYNTLGKGVTPLLDEVKNAGEYEIHWDGMNQRGKKLSSGIYLVRMAIGREVLTIKLLMLK